MTGQLRKQWNTYLSVSASLSSHYSDFIRNYPITNPNERCFSLQCISYTRTQLYILRIYSNSCAQAVCMALALIHKEKYLKWRSESILNREGINYGAELGFNALICMHWRRNFNCETCLKLGEQSVYSDLVLELCVHFYDILWFPRSCMEWIKTSFCMVSIPCPLSLLHSLWTLLNFIVTR